MSLAERMIATNPSRPLVDADILARCIEACRRCESACNDILSAMAA